MGVLSKGPSLIGRSEGSLFKADPLSQDRFWTSDGPDPLPEERFRTLLESWATRVIISGDVQALGVRDGCVGDVQTLRTDPRADSGTWEARLSL